MIILACMGCGGKGKSKGGSMKKSSHATTMSKGKRVSASTNSGTVMVQNSAGSMSGGRSMIRGSHAMPASPNRMRRH